MRFNCPRCGEFITSDLAVGDFASCTNCKADLKILADDVVAVYTGIIPGPVVERDDFNLTEMEEAEFQAAVLTVTDELPQDDKIRQYNCPSCMSMVFTENEPGECVNCEDCGAELKIMSPREVALVSTLREEAEVKAEAESKRQLTLKAKTRVQTPQVAKDRQEGNVPKILKFTCPQCDSEVKTQRLPGDSFMCYQCGGELRILSADAVTLVLGDEPDINESQEQALEMQSDSFFKGMTSKEMPPPAGRDYQFLSAQRLKSPSGNLRKIKAAFKVLSGTIAALLIFVAAAVLFADFKQEKIIVHPIHVPQSLQQDGLTPEVIATRIIDQVHFIAESATTSIYASQPGGLELESAPAISLAGPGSSWATITSPIKSIMGKAPVEISGEVVAYDKVLCLTMRISNDEQGNGFKRRDIYGSLADIDLLFNEAAGFVMEAIQPNTMAVYLENRSRSEAGYDFRVVIPADLDQNPDLITPDKQ